MRKNSKKFEKVRKKSKNCRLRLLFFFFNFNLPSTLQSGSLDQLKDFNGLEDCGTFLLILDFWGWIEAVGGGGGPGGGGGAIGGATGGEGITTDEVFDLVMVCLASINFTSVSESLCFSSLWRAASVSNFSLVRSRLASTSSFSWVLTSSSASFLASWATTQKF